MALLLTASYLAYAIAEAFELSGTLTLLFAALTLGKQAHTSTHTQEGR